MIGGKPEGNQLQGEFPFKICVIYTQFTICYIEQAFSY